MVAPYFASPTIGKPRSRQLHPELMASSRLRSQFEFRRIRPAFQHPKPDACLLPHQVALLDDSRAVKPPVLLESIFPLPFALRRPSLDDRPVDLRDRPRAELCREPPSGLAGPGDQDHAGRRPIEPVEEPDVHVPRLPVPLLEIPRHEVDQALRASLVPLRRQSRGLVERQTMIIFEQRVQIHRFERLTNEWRTPRRRLEPVRSERPSFPIRAPGNR